MGNSKPRVSEHGVTLTVECVQWVGNGGQSM